MPTMQTALSSMNQSFGSTSSRSLPGLPDEVLDAFRPGPNTSLVAALRLVQSLDLPDQIFDYIDTWPSALQRAVQAVIWENFSRDASVPITFAWVPGYDYSVTIYDVVDTADTAGGITILFTSRYPRDPHPLATERPGSPQSASTGPAGAATGAVTKLPGGSR